MTGPMGVTMAGDKVVEDLKFHQETIASDSNSPLHLIREKEMEISGRMLSAKREADEIIGNARKKAAEIMNVAEAESGAGARSRSESIMADANGQAAELRTKSEAEAEEIRSLISTRKAEAVRLVVDAVTEL